MIVDSNCLKGIQAPSGTIAWRVKNGLWGIGHLRLKTVPKKEQDAIVSEAAFTGISAAADPRPNLTVGMKRRHSTTVFKENFYLTLACGSNLDLFNWQVNAITLNSTTNTLKGVE